MGGKSYFCDYCRCYMKNDKNVRKTHNEGLAHKITKVSIMRKYEDPRKIYEEEIVKQPCTRYFKNFCKYHLYCQYTHFNETQLKQLKDIIENKTNSTTADFSHSAHKTKSASTTKVINNLPWENSITKRKLKLLPTKLPLSLRPLNLKKLSKFNPSNSKWGT